MASWVEIQEHIAALEELGSVHADCTYRGIGLPKWLGDNWEQVKRESGDRSPALIINVKGTRVDDTPVVLRLVDYERLLDR